MNRPPDKRSVVRDPAFVTRWKRRQVQRCQVCWIPAYRAAMLRVGDFLLEAHHIAQGPARSDEPANLILICSHCHRCAHGETVCWNGTTYPPLTPGMILQAKHEAAPEEYWPERLLILLGWNEFPQRWREVPLPNMFVDERRKWSLNCVQ